MGKNLQQWWKDNLKTDNLDKLINKSNDILDRLSKEDNSILDELITDEEYFNDNDYAYDPDSSPVAWKYYEQMYGWVQSDILMGWDSKAKRIIGDASINKDGNSSIEVKHVNYKYGTISFAGDCVFNFKEGGKTLKCIKENKLNDNALQKLKFCRAMHHSPYNFSLIPRTGEMNNRKKCDRPDWLLAGIEHLYTESDKCEKEIKTWKEIRKLQKDYQVITHRSRSRNDEVLFTFLKLIGGVEKYANIFLNLGDKNDDDQKMLKDMIEFGKDELSEDSFEQYMDLAIRYWQIQRKKYEAVCNL